MIAQTVYIVINQSLDGSCFLVFTKPIDRIFVWLVDQSYSDNYRVLYLDVHYKESMVRMQDPSLALEDFLM